MHILRFYFVGQKCLQYMIVSDAVRRVPCFQLWWSSQNLLVIHSLSSSDFDGLPYTRVKWYPHFFIKVTAKDVIDITCIPQIIFFSILERPGKRRVANCLYHMLEKFEQNRMVLYYTNISTLFFKGAFLKPFYKPLKSF